MCFNVVGAANILAFALFKFWLLTSLAPALKLLARVPLPSLILLAPSINCPELAASCWVPFANWFIPFVNVGTWALSCPRPPANWLPPFANWFTPLVNAGICAFIWAKPLANWLPPFANWFTPLVNAGICAFIWPIPPANCAEPVVNIPFLLANVFIPFVALDTPSVYIFTPSFSFEE